MVPEELEMSSNDTSIHGLVDYWQRLLSDHESVPFPALPRSLSHVSRDEILECEFPKINNEAKGFPASTLIFAAWALVVSQQTNTEDILFGTVAPTRAVSVENGDETMSHADVAIPMRIKMLRDQKLFEYVNMVRRQVSDMKLFKPSHLDEIAKISAACRQACKFQTILVMKSKDHSLLTVQQEERNHALELQVDCDRNVYKVVAKFDPRAIETWVVKNLLQRLHYVVQQLEAAGPDTRVSKIGVASATDLDRIWEWNNSTPASVDQLAHAMFEEQSRRQPDALAIRAWDGSLTYGELNRLTTDLADRVTGSGVAPDSVVALCFEKSMWTTVAMLGVLKAGLAFVLLDPSLPEHRLQLIVEKVKAQLVLSSASCQSLALRLAQKVIAIGEKLFDESTEEVCTYRNAHDASSLMYVVFTSGSTGTPKGTAISHRNLVSALTYQTESLGITSESKIYDFSAYSFDVSIFNTWAALTLGACLCVPNEQDRRDRLAESIESFGADFAYLTPSVARQLSPQKVPSLKSLILIGEALHASDIAPWWGKVHFVNAYGPSECTTASTVNSTSTTVELATRIGKGLGQVTWIVDADNHNSLTPPGCTGELVLEGPLVGLGYVDEPEKTAAAYITDPTWLSQGSSKQPGRHGRIYKTGDLVRYNEDGSLSFVGRKDTQVKIRGNRVELGEVEHWIQKYFPDALQVVAEVVVPAGDNASPLLTAFIRLGQTATESQPDSSAAPTIFSAPTEVHQKLVEFLPSYMIPTMICTVKEIPMTPSGKIDRKALRQLGASFSVQQLAEIQTAGAGPKRAPTTELEKQMHRIWAKVLGIDATTIGLDDSFFRLGGDSIAAMKVVGEARKIGLELSVANMFRRPSLEEVVQDSVAVQDESTDSIPPFSLLAEKVTAPALLEDISTRYGIEPRRIQDVYPCTPLQEGFMSLSSKQSGDYITQATLKLAPSVDMDAFRSAWETVAASNDILRTRIIQNNDLGLLQVVLNEQISWIEETTSLDGYCREDSEVRMEIGQPLTRYALIKGGIDRPGWFVWTIHHALYDGWSMPLIIAQVNRVYQGLQLDQGPRFQSFIQYLKSGDSQKQVEYWQRSLQDCQCPQFPALTPSVQQPLASSTIKRSIRQPNSHSLNLTTSTLIRGAWALVTGAMTNSSDVVFGVTVSGRNAPVAAIDMMPAPTIATVPLRIRLDKIQNVSEYLKSLQEQFVEMIPFEQMGLHQIAKINADSHQACTFQTLLVVQPQETNAVDSAFGNWTEGYQQQKINTYGLVLEIQLQKERVVAMAHFDPRLIQPWLVERLLERTEFVMQQLGQAHIDKTLGQLEMITPQEKDQIWAWNNAVPVAIDRCIHHLVRDHAVSQPEAPAICAWDGELTWGELDRLTTSLAGRLCQYGVVPGMFVPLCFEKSMWTPVVMLSILKAGGAFVLLDSHLPEQRLLSIVDQVKATLIISSPQNEQLSSQLRDKVVTLHKTYVAELWKDDSNAWELNKVQPSDTAYAIFTSGSTGTPKGVLATHRNVVSTVPHLVKAFGETSDSRIYDFASYSFGAAFNNFFTALVAGACLCVPSDDDRMNHLARSLASLRATHMFITPSLAATLSPEMLPDLQTVIIGGEQMYPKDVIPWRRYVRVLAVYGSSECTSISVVNNSSRNVLEAIRIGKGTGAVTWVVDPDDHDKLVPLGGIGELVQEGPAVTLGYLGDKEKTEAAFIEDPAWLLSGATGRPGRHGRLYKTGDLVHYNEDGSLSFAGRKDYQVKIRGQRVELGEVEVRLREIFPEALHIVAELITPQGSNSSSELAAFIQTKDKLELSEAIPAKVLSVDAAILENLGQYLPSYMVPTAFLAVEKLPMTATGKMNRKRLREIGASFSAQQLAVDRTDAHDQKRQPETDFEREMQSIWAKVLNLEPSMIGMDDSFLGLGGDSITAMQVASAARTLSVRLRVADILREKTISKLSSIVPATRPKLTSHQESLDGPNKTLNGNQLLQLSPIQRLYFELQPRPTDCFDQFFYFRLRQRITSEALSQALEAIVRRHAPLRARFRKTQDGAWKQRIANNASRSFHLHSEECADADVPQRIAQCRERLNIESGPLVAAALLNKAEHQTLFWTIHHVVIDLVSWRVLFQELEHFLTNGSIDSPMSTDFLTWTSMQTEFAKHNLAIEAAAPVNAQSYLQYWGIESDANIRDCVVTKTFALDETISSALLGGCNNALGTRPVELMIAALIHSFHLVFPDRAPPPVFTEGHGREPWDDGIDVSSTVGWFTTIFPVKVAVDQGTSIKEIISQTKDGIRNLPKNGWPYFTSRFADEARAKVFSKEFPVEIMFNYAGHYQQLERKDGLIEEAKMPEGCDPPTSLNIKRFAMFELDLRIDRGCLSVSMEFHRDMQKRDQVLQWMEEYKSIMRKVATELPSLSVDWTLSDFPLAFKSYQDIKDFREVSLRNLQISPEDVEDVFPCSPIQEGMFLAQSKDPQSYLRSSELDVRLNEDTSELDVAKLEKAWRSVVKKHPLLRTILLDTVPGTSRVMHVVLKDAEPDVRLISSEDDASTSQLSKYGLQHSLTICKIDKKTAKLRIEMNHAIIDGFAHGIMCNDLQLAYQGLLNPVNTASYKDFIFYLETQSLDKGIEFWKERLGNVDPVELPGSLKVDARSQCVRTIVPNIDTAKIRAFCAKWNVTPATFIQTAWALVLSLFSGSKLPCFGNLCSGRDVPVDGINDIMGPCIGMVPYRISLQDSKSVIDVLRAVDTDYQDSLPYQHVPLAEIHRALGIGSGRLFNNIMSFQRTELYETNQQGGLSIHERDCTDPTEYDMAIDVMDGGQKIDIICNFRPNFITDGDASCLANCFSTTISEMATNPSKPAKDLSLLGDSDLRRIWQWNGSLPVPSERCAHSMIEERSRQQPDAPAVCAWDGNLTYAELDRLATCIADELVTAGIGEDMIIPLCFEKSKWAPVAVLSVLKAGGAFTLLDPSLPEERLRSIVQQTNAPFILSSAENINLSSRIARVVKEISPATTSRFERSNTKPRPQSASTTMYAVFTSGSTGIPKGVVVSHQSFCTAIDYQLDAYGITTDSRVFDFSSYAFDIGMHDMLMTLMVGGCFCIPSENDRRNVLSESITSMGATVVSLTPTVARLLDPASVPTLKSIMLLGEAVTAADAERWWGRVSVMNVYGPAECVVTTINHKPSSPEEASWIGKGFGIVNWIVDPEDTSKLLPPGCVGELLAEGPLLFKGYLNGPEQTAAACLHDPDWLVDGTAGFPGRHGRLYKTGDLVRYTKDGNLIYVGRKDAQVKIRGQRVELGEVEHRVQQSMQEATRVAAEVIQPRSDTPTSQLAVFLQIPHESTHGGATSDSSAEILPIPTQVRDELSRQLPSYMIPTVFFSMSKFPTTATGKLNRRHLREIGASFSAQQLADVQTSGPKREPTTQAERQMQQIWARALSVNTTQIGLDDSFFHLGGDSVGAMKVVGEARKAGLQLSVADIFCRPKLIDVAARAARGAGLATSDDIPPFSLLKSNLNRASFLSDVSTQYGLEAATIEDAYPCSPLQQGLLSLTLKQTGSYTLQSTLELPSDLQMDAFRDAWQRVVQNMTILRTRIVQHNNAGLMQLVLKDEIEWADTVGLEHHLEADRKQPMEMGSRLARYTLVRDETGAHRWFVWTIHHALYDGWSLPIILEAVNREYSGKRADKTVPFKSFIKYIEEKDDKEMASYWQNALENCNGVPFPALTSSVRQPAAQTNIEHEFAVPRLRGALGNITTSALIRAAWALVAQGMTGSSDVVFGLTVSGRSAPVAGIENMAGPAFATVPVRIKLDNDQVALDYLNMLQRQATEMIHYEQMGLHRISKISADTQHACNFQTLVVVQPEPTAPTTDVIGKWTDGDQQQWFNTYGLLLTVDIGKNNLIARANFDSRLIEPWVVGKLLSRLEHTMHQLDSVYPGQTLAEIDAVTREDLETIWKWNAHVPEAATEFVHEMIENKARQQPDALAVDAWDGQLTYSELDQMSTFLAGYLSSSGVKRGTMVSLCFEKSMWATVSMLAVMKSGGTFVFLDTTFPEARLQTISQHVGATLTLSSASTKPLASKLCQNVTVVDAELTKQIATQRLANPVGPSFSSLTYVVYTSGTTGTPKGITISQKSSASAVLHQVARFGYSPKTRLYDFSTYSFDGTMLNAFTVLAVGGCLCIPSEPERRNDLAGSITSLKANTVFLTPSVAEMLTPATVPTLKCMILGGEAIGAKDVRQWWDKIRVFTIYGPSECTPVTMLNEHPLSPEAAIGLGRGSGITTWVVDPENHNVLMPLGCIGELLLEGHLVGCGYLNEPEKTASAFIENPNWLLRGAAKVPGRHGRLYKTGDLVKYNEDGTISYVARKDAQIKIRGQRVELGEVEHRLQQAMPEASQVGVELIGLQGTTSGPLLAAFLQIDVKGERKSQDDDHSATIISIPADAEDKLAGQLPSYMIPAVFFSMRHIPMSAAGKMNRKRLRQIGSSFSTQQVVDIQAGSQESKRQPVTDVERWMQEIWAMVLGIEPRIIGLDDSFFKLGGDSMAAMKVAAESRKNGMRLNVSDIFKLRRLQAVSRSASSLGAVAPVHIPKSELTGPSEQSFAQERLWFLDQLHPGLSWYLIPCAVRIKGPLNLDALNSAISAVESRHETLRTLFYEKDGINYQSIQPFQPKEIKVIDFSLKTASDVNQILEQEQSTPIDLTTDPGWRVSLYKMGEESYILSIIMHHIVSDGWSVDILRKELALFYSAALHGKDPLTQISPLPIQYRDFSAWQKQPDQAKRLQGQLEYWVDQLKTSRPAEFFYDKPRPKTLSGNAQEQQMVIEGDLYKKLQGFCKEKDITPFVALLAAFRATHFHLTGVADATLGSPNANRNNWEVKDLIGFFVNLQCIRIKMENESFDELVQRVHTTTTESFANQDVPFERIVSSLQIDRDLSRQPLVQVVFAVHSQKDLGNFTLEGLKTQQIDLVSTSRFDLEMHFYQEEEALKGTTFYSTDIYHSETISNMLHVFSRLLVQVLESPYVPITSLSLLSDEDYDALDNMGLINIDRPEFPRHSSVTEVFQQQVAIHPDRLAIKDETTSLTYAELDQQSDIIAQWLMSRRLRQETLVGVFANRSCQAVTAFLGILKANLAYVPFDVNTPSGRIDTILRSFGEQKIILLGDNTQIPAIESGFVELVKISHTLDQQPNNRSGASIDPVSGPSAGSLAYVMYTSGSTGQPKGVMIEHRNILRLVKQNRMFQDMPLSPTIAHISNPAFDAATWEIYFSLLNGGTLICVDRMTLLDYQRLSRTLTYEKVQALFITPALLKQYLIECPNAVKNLEAVYVGGDRLDPGDMVKLQALIPGTIINGYGPTENTSFSTFYRLVPGDSYPIGVPIGRALSNSGAYIMDKHQRIVPLGVVGELVVTGDGLARGYIDPQFNIDRFISVEIAGQVTRAYRTGDYARYRPIDGQLDFLGRIDGQIKLRGQRLELGEVEHVLLSHKSVEDAVAILRQEEGKEPQIISFATVRENSDGDDTSATESHEKSTRANVSGHVDAWEQMFDTETYTGFENIEPSAVGRDFVGWTSMYDGSEIDKEEMNEWLDDTIHTILNGSLPGNVLEIGTGSGMILFNILEGLKSYVGLDPSTQALSLIAKTVKRVPGLSKKVTMFKATASEIGQLSLPCKPNLVVVNSVAQYFPSQEYLFRLIQDLFEIGSIDTLYFGDMRSYALYTQFLTTRALRMIGTNVTKTEIRRVIEDMKRIEREFLVDPAFFTSLVARLPELVDHVEIIPKKMEATNELSCYRFAAVVYTKAKRFRQEQIHKIPEADWIDFMERRLDHQSLGKLLHDSSTPSIVALSNIPYSKTILERCVLKELENKDAGDSDNISWLSSARTESKKMPSLSPVDLVKLGEDAGYRVEISWARQFSQCGGLDAVFHRLEPTEAKRVLFQFPTDHDGRKLSSLTNRPLQHQLNHQIQEELFEMLKAKLPSYMIPQAITVIEKMPINDNGKVDRKRLAETAQAPVMRGLLQQPTNDSERQMQSIWATILNKEPSSIGLDDGFFQIGGDSLAAMKVVGQARKLGLQLVVADVFRSPKLRDVAALAKPATNGSSATIPSCREPGPVEQSFAQGRLWFLEQLHPGLTWYLMPCAIRLRGPLQLDALNAALNALEARHDTLRTTFLSKNGISMQQVHPFQAKALQIVDVHSEEDLKDELKKDELTPFDLELDPGWRVKVYRRNSNHHVLSIVMHHIISDGWSVDILRRELTAYYAASLQGQNPLSNTEPLPIQYRDFSVWQRQPEQLAEHNRQLDYWVNQLETSQPAELLCDKPRPAALSGKAGVEGLKIEGDVYSKLKETCETHGVTPFVTLLAAFRATHYRLTGTSDATIGTVNANRDRWEIKDMIGFFVNLQCIRITVEEDSFDDLIRQVHSASISSLANQDIPFENIVSKLQKDRDLSRQPLAQILFAFHSQVELDKFELQGLDTEAISAPPTTRFDLEFHFYQEKQALRGEVIFSTDLYTSDTINNMLLVFSRVLEQAISEPKAPIISLALNTDEDDSILESMGLINVGKKNYPRNSSVIDIFRQKASTCPDRIAVKDSSSQLSYAHLDKLSDTAARWLVGQSMPAGALVGVFSPRSCQAVVAFLAILKANLAIIPFDVKVPLGRLETILSEIPSRTIVLTGQDVETPRLQLEGVTFVPIEDLLDVQESKGELQVYPPPSANSLAYVLFTSGSTGTPKGVMLEHRGILRLTQNSSMTQYLPKNPVMAHMTNLTFDLSIWELYGALLNGGTVICIDHMAVLDARSMYQIFSTDKVQAAITTPALLKMYLAEYPSIVSGLHALYVAGERADASDLFTVRKYTSGHVINAYGPSENSVISTLYCLQKTEKCTNGVPIGRAISNSGAYVMDHHQRLVPIGVIGELVVTGDGLARGYTDPKRDVERFVSIEIRGVQTKAYRTGDYVRYRPTDGQLEFFGRIDGQVKIRGNRVELGEIEHVLRSHESVTDSVALLHHEEGQEAQIVGFVAVPDVSERGIEESNGANEHVEVWEDVFDAETYNVIDTVQPENIGRDFIGWNSSYDGEPIDKRDMNEWLDDTIETILDGNHPLEILEIGSGTGMILFNLGSRLESYIGLEPSKRAVDFVINTSKSLEGVADKVRMYKGTATDIRQLKTTASPKTVIINSVAQYFPSQEYLLRVITDLLDMDSVETIFFGDVRSFALDKYFRAGRAYHALAESAIKEDYKQSMTEMERTELELLVDPGFFTGLPKRLPGIEHVEVLPKKMKATNELSCYRYAAVLHINRHDKLQQIRKIDNNSWIDFMEHGLDSQSLLDTLQQSSKSTVAVSNIPFDKILLERYIVDAIENSPDSYDWLQSAQRNAQKCPTVSVVGLLELARLAGYRVELSCARQHSQKGGLDAIFHRHQPTDGHTRVLFQFPTDDNGRPTHLLSSQPLRQQFNQKVQKELTSRLEAHLPRYMVPQVINILQRLPLNQNGKVDRKALAAKVQRVKSRRAFRPPTTMTEKQMQAIWAQVLSIRADIIGLDDSFFHLGGNSITAMKVVAETRKLGLELVVADIFRNDTLIGLSSQCRAISTVPEDSNVPLIDPSTKSSLINEMESLGINEADIEDIFPTTSFQTKCIVEGQQMGQLANYFYLDLGTDLDISRFTESCRSIVAMLPILRTLFLTLKGKHWQVVLRRLDTTIHILQTTVSLDESCHQFCLGDLKDVGATEPPISITLVRNDREGFRLILRLSHAQYDGISFPMILQYIMDGYRNIPISKGPAFSKFLSYASKRRGKSSQYWQKLLQGSSPTKIMNKLQPDAILQNSPVKAIKEEAEVTLPRLPGKVTPATVFSAAWAVLLSIVSGDEDVVYGMVVAGRNSGLVGINEVIGPCLNIIPSRVRLSDSRTPAELLMAVQDQYLDLGEADSMGLQDIVESCTEWPTEVSFDSVIQHQNIDEHPEVDGSAGGSKVQFFENPNLVPPSLFLASYPKGSHLHIKLFANTHIMRPDAASLMLRNLVSIIEGLTMGPNEPLQETMGNVNLSLA